MSGNFLAYCFQSLLVLDSLIASLRSDTNSVLSDGVLLSSSSDVFCSVLLTFLGPTCYVQAVFQAGFDHNNRVQADKRIEPSINVHGLPPTPYLHSMCSIFCCLLTN